MAPRFYGITVLPISPMLCPCFRALIGMAIHTRYRIESECDVAGFFNYDIKSRQMLVRNNTQDGMQPDDARCVPTNPIA